MSQEKIDRYKEEKANRKKELAKQKRNAIIGKVVGVVGIIALIGWIGWSGYRSHQQQKEYDAAMSSINAMLATYDASSETTTKGVNLEQSPDKVTTGDETKEGETTSTKDETETTSEHDHEHEEETTA